MLSVSELRGVDFMKKIKHFYIKNQMIIANGIANLIGVLWVNKVIMFTTDEKIQAKIWGIASLFG